MDLLVQRFSGILPVLGELERYEVAPVAVNPPNYIERRQGEWFGVDPAVYPDTARELARAGNYQEVIKILFENPELGYELLVPIGDCDYRLKIKNLFVPEIRQSKFFCEFRDNVHRKYGIEVFDLEPYYNENGIYPGGRAVVRSELGMFTDVHLQGGRLRAEEQRYIQAEMQVDPAPLCGEVPPEQPPSIDVEQTLEFNLYPAQAANTDEANHANALGSYSAEQATPQIKSFPGINLKAILSSMHRYPSAERFEPTADMFKKLRHRSEQCTNSIMRQFYDNVTFHNYKASSIEEKRVILEIIANDYAEYKKANAANRKRKKQGDREELVLLRSLRRRKEEEAQEREKPPDEEYEPAEEPGSPSYAPESPLYQPNVADD